VGLISCNLLVVPTHRKHQPPGFGGKRKIEIPWIKGVRGGSGEEGMETRGNTLNEMWGLKRYEGMGPNGSCVCERAGLRKRLEVFGSLPNSRRSSSSFCFRKKFGGFRSLSQQNHVSSG